MLKISLPKINLMFSRPDAIISSLSPQVVLHFLIFIDLLAIHDYFLLKSGNFLRTCYQVVVEVGMPYGHRNQHMDGMACCLLDSLHRFGGDHGDEASKAFEERNHHEVGSVLHGLGTFQKGSQVVAVHNQRNAEKSVALYCWNDDVRFSTVVVAMAAVVVATVVVLGHLHCCLLSSVDLLMKLSLLAFFPSSGDFLLFSAAQLVAWCGCCWYFVLLGERRAWNALVGDCFLFRRRDNCLFLHLCACPLNSCVLLL